jgi:hypothetical protein
MTEVNRSVAVAELPEGKVENADLYNREDAGRVGKSAGAAESRVDFCKSKPHPGPCKARVRFIAIRGDQVRNAHFAGEPPEPGLLIVLTPGGR